MKTLDQSDGFVDLGDACVETRGILEDGQKDVQNDGRFLLGGISAED
jgi:hypothetical protein